MGFRRILVLIALACLSRTAAADYAGTVLSLSPAAYWRLNETAPIPRGNRALNNGSVGAEADGFYNGNSLHPVNGALVASPDTAAAFDGTAGTWVSIPNLPALNPKTPFSVEFWVNPNSSRPGDEYPSAPVASLQRSTSEAYGWVFYQLASGWNFSLGNSTGYGLNLSSQTVPQPGYWYHLVAVFDGKNGKLYVNGVEEASGVVAGTYAPNRQVPLGIGGRGDGAFPFDGIVDEVVIYPGVLSLTDIQTHYYNAISPFPPAAYSQLILGRSPLGYYRLNDPPYNPLPEPVAYNIGSRGSAVDGTYYAGMTNGGAGPRPPQFNGFAADNRAAEFNGAGGYVGTRYQLDYLPGFTLLGWVRRGANHTARGAFLGQSGFVEVGEADGGASIEVAVAAYNRSLRVPYPFSPDQWGFLAVVADGTQVTLYTNSVPAGSLTGSVPNYGASGMWFNLGARELAATGDWFRGGLDEVAVFERPLTAEQIQSIYSAAGVAPQIVAQPQPPAGPLYAGNVFSLTVAATGTLPLGYQWRKGGTALNGQTGATLTFNPAATTHSGPYDVVVKNNYGSVTSVVVNLTVLPANPPVILQPPQSHARFVSRAAVFTVEAAGTPPLSYQWQFNDGDLPNQQGASLSLSNLTTAQDGWYRVIVKNPILPAGVTTEAARLTVMTPPVYASAVIADQPLAYWRLGEDSGTIANDAWGAHDGQYVNVALGKSGYSAGDTNTAASFAPERDSCVQVTNSAPFDFTGLNPSFTVECWVRFQSVSGSQRIVSNRHTPAGPTGGYAFGLNGADHLRFSAFGVQNLDSPPIEPPLLAGKWYHLALVLQDGLITFYVNGRSLGSAYGLISPLASSPEAFQLGRNPEDALGEEELEGTLDEVAVYAQALSPTRLQAHFDARDAGNVPPVFTVQPVPRSAYSGRPARFTAVAEGSAPVRYQWTVNGVPLSAATNETLVWSAGPGSYEIASLAANAAGSTKCTNATFKVEPRPLSCDLPQDLVLHLGFEGDLKDSSGRGNHAAPVGSPTLETGQIGFGSLGYRTDADAIPKVFDYVTVGKPSDLLFGTNVNFSVAFWIRWSGLAGNLPFLANNLYSTGDAGYSFAPSAWGGGWAWSLNDARQPKAWGGIVVSDLSSTSLNDNDWHHLAFSFDRAGNAVTYVDGLPVDETSLRPAIGWDLNTGRPVNLGQASGTYPASGEFELDDLGVWRRVLTPFEVDNIFLVGASLRQSFAPVTATTVTLEIKRAGADLQLLWNGQGTLQFAPRVTGPWLSNTNATSPFPVSPKAARQFYRVKL